MAAATLMFRLPQCRSPIAIPRESPSRYHQRSSFRPHSSNDRSRSPAFPSLRTPELLHSSVAVRSLSAALYADRVIVAVPPPTAVSQTRHVEGFLSSNRPQFEFDVLSMKISSILLAEGDNLHSHDYHGLQCRHYSRDGKLFLGRSRCK